MKINVKIKILWAMFSMLLVFMMIYDYVQFLSSDNSYPIHHTATETPKLDYTLTILFFTIFLRWELFL